MGIPPEYRNALHISLVGKDNATYRGTLVLRNWTLQYPGSLAPSNASNSSSSLHEDPTGASYYVIAVVLVYGMSIVLLIASHISRNHHKQEQDKQIHKYFQEFLVVKEKSNREAYKKLKKSIVKKLMWENNPTYRNLSRVIIPAIAVPVGDYLLTVTSEQELDALRRDRRESSPAASSITDINGSVQQNNKLRRKGLGHLFTATPPKDFELSVLEKLTELKEIRQEVRDRVNSIANSNAGSFEISGLRCSEVESGSESNTDNHSEDSHITLPAITIRGPSPEPPPIRRSPLPTIDDTEDSICCTDDEDGDMHPQTENAAIWLMGDFLGIPKLNSFQRRVHFSNSTKHRAAIQEKQDDKPCRTAAKSDKLLTLVRQDNVMSSDSDDDEDLDEDEDVDDGYSDSEPDGDDEVFNKITCV